MTDSEVAEVVHDLVTTDVGGRGTIVPITGAHDPGDPPPLRAAELLRDAVDPGDAVVVLTGFPIPPTMVPETDGPPGAAALAAALDRGLDATAVVACEPGAVEACEAAVNAAGLGPVDRETALASRRTAAVEALPTDRDAAADYAADLVSDLDPAAVVAVEKVGPNRAGVYHNMAGYDVSDATAKVEELYDRLDAPTVAVGDAGNEVGMGVVESAVRDAIPYGETCQCDCGDGIAAALGADALVPAAVSNWGAYGVAAALSALVGDDLVHDPATERRMLHAASRAGAIDGIGGGTTGWCDGLPPDAHASMVRLLGETVSASVHDRGGGELGR